MTEQLTVQVILICSSVALGKTTRAVALKVAGATKQKQKESIYANEVLTK